MEDREGEARRASARPSFILTGRSALPESPMSQIAASFQPQSRNGALPETIIMYVVGKSIYDCRWLPDSFPAPLLSKEGKKASFPRI